MKRFACLLAVGIAALLITSDARAAEPAGSINQDALAAMGLSGLEVMSDTEGEKVRGTFAIAFGYGTSRFFGGDQTSVYAAGDFGRGVDFATGGNNSSTGFSFVVTQSILGIPVASTNYTFGTFATGSSYAFSGR